MNRRIIFDRVRSLLGRGFKQSEVEALDAAIDRAMRETGEQLAKESGGTLHTSREGIELIHQFESCSKLRPDGLYEAYPDPGSKDGHPWTIGWGSTGVGVVPGTVWTKAQCDARFAADLKRYEEDVREAIGKAPTTQRQFDALVSFHYNTGAIAKATLTRKHKAGDHEGAAKEFRKWVFNDGTKMNGLVRRREAEAALYRKGM